MPSQSPPHHRPRLSPVRTGFALLLAATGCSDHFDLGELVQNLDPGSGGDGGTSQPASSAEPVGISESAGATEPVVTGEPAGTSEFVGANDPASSTELDGTVLFASTDDVDVVVENAPLDYSFGSAYPPVAVGDVDGDGLGDWIQGTTLYYGSARPAGATLVAGDRVALHDAAADQCRLFFNFEPAGDLNGDGYADIFYNVTDCLVWYSYPEPIAPSPAIPSYLLLGGPERRTGTLELSTDAIPFGDRDRLIDRFADQLAANPTDATARQATSLRSLGDLDADGIVDFSVSTRIELRLPVYTFDEALGENVITGQEFKRETVSYVYYGSPSLSTTTEPAARLDAPVLWQDVGDVDGDGARDTLLTSPERYYLWRGGTARLSGDLSLAEGATPIDIAKPLYDQMDAPVRALGDLDGDGIDDFALSGIVPAGDSYDWPLYLFYGRPGLLEQPVRVEDNAAVFEVYGAGTLTSLGDWDGDGRNDLLLDRSVMAEGTSAAHGDAPAAREAALVRGGSDRFAGTYTLAPERAGLVKPEDTANASTRYAPVPAGDLDGDGFDDLFVWALDEGTPPTFELAIKYGSPDLIGSTIH